MSHPVGYAGIMKTDVTRSSESPEPDVIATFGGAKLVRILGKHKRWEIRGGTEEEQRQAREWAERFLTDPSRGHNDNPAAGIRH